MTKKGVIKTVFEKELAKHQKLLRDKRVRQEVSNTIQSLERVRDELIERVKALADYDGYVYTASLLGQHFTKHEYHEKR